MNYCQLRSLNEISSCVNLHWCHINVQTILPFSSTKYILPQVTAYAGVLILQAHKKSNMLLIRKMVHMADTCILTMFTVTAHYIAS